MNRKKWQVPLQLAQKRLKFGYGRERETEREGKKDLKEERRKCDIRNLRCSFKYKFFG